MSLPNWIPDQNRYSLAGPPSWFLRQLWEFDNTLVLVPSRQGFFYRLTQRSPTRLATAIVNDIMKEQADTAMLMSYGLVPITTVLATVRWDNPVIWQDLRQRAPWRMGGAAAYEQKIIAQEKAEELEKAAKQDDMLDYLSKDSWKYYQKKAGLRTHLYSPKTKTGTAKESAAPALSFPKPAYKPSLVSAWGDVLKPRK